MSLVQWIYFSVPTSHCDPGLVAGRPGEEKGPAPATGSQHYTQVWDYTAVCQDIRKGIRKINTYFKAIFLLRLIIAWFPHFLQVYQRLHLPTQRTLSRERVFPGLCALFLPHESAQEPSQERPRQKLARTSGCSDWGGNLDLFNYRHS